MALILCIETATTNCSVALSDGGRVLAEKSVNEGYSHAEKLTLMIMDVLSDAGKTLAQTDAIAVSSGPGSYTGLRIGVSTAKGLCYGLDKPLISISTLEAMANGMKAESNGALLCPMIDARRMEVYCALFDKDLKCLQVPQAIIVDENFLAEERKSNSLLLAGDGADKCESLFAGESSIRILKNFYPEARFMAVLAESKWKADDFENVGLYEPFYLKEWKQ